MILVFAQELMPGKVGMISDYFFVLLEWRFGVCALISGIDQTSIVKWRTKTQHKDTLTDFLGLPDEPINNQIK
jgi:hypothetical protein